MNTRAETIKFITYHIVNGRGIKIYVDGHTLRLQYTNLGYVIWHDETDKNIAAIIHEEDSAHKDVYSEWAQSTINE